jgi:regulatory protein
MGGRITALRVQRRNRNRVNVYLDGRFAFGLAAIEAARLQVGQVLSDEDIARLRQRDTAERAAERALDLLSYRPRSEAEIRERLTERYDPETAGEVLERLRRSGLVDDREFARYWVQNRLEHNPRGAVALRQELYQKGVDESAIEEALAEYDEEEAATRAAETARRKLRGLPPDVFRRRLTDYLLRRGFSYGVVRAVVQQALEE